MQTLTPEQLNALHFEALTDRRTVAKAYRGERVGALTRRRIERAVETLRARGHAIPMVPAL